MLLRAHSHRSRKRPSWPAALAVAACASALALALRADAAAPAHETIGGRDAVVYVPDALPPRGTRALVVVLHGAFGNANAIESGLGEAGLGMDALADRVGFVVAYLDGTPISPFAPAGDLGWNAGSCCGAPARTGVDDVAYIAGAVRELTARYGVDPARTFAIGHSNGAMMIERVACEAGIFAAIVPVAGSLVSDPHACPGARGRRILAIHGADDENVPIAGGHGSESRSPVAYPSEDATRKTFGDAGARFELDVVAGAGHRLDEIDAALTSSEKTSVARKAAQFFELLPTGR